jgi:hypothetical protein
MAYAQRIGNVGFRIILFTSSTIILIPRIIPDPAVRDVQEKHISLFNLFDLLSNYAYHAVVFLVDRRSSRGKYLEGGTADAPIARGAILEPRKRITVTCRNSSPVTSFFQAGQATSVFSAGQATAAE